MKKRLISILLITIIIFNTNIFKVIAESPAEISFINGNFQYTILKDATANKSGKVSICIKDAVSQTIKKADLPNLITNKGLKYKVVEIQGNGFTKCDKLETLIIPDGVTIIGELAFYQCELLSNVIIPKSVNKIGYKAFDGTDWFESQKLIGFGPNKENLMLIVVNNILIDGDFTIGRKYYIDPGTVVVQSKVISIGDYAFHGQSMIIEIILPSKLKTISDGAFSGCGKLNNIYIPNRVTSIGAYAFNSCSELSKINIPNSVTTIGDYAFSFCDSLKKVTIPNSVTTIGEGAFSYCDDLETITIPNSVNTISKEAFSHCWYLKTATITNGVTMIGDEAFKGCNRLKTVIIPKSVTSIGYGAFDDCSSLRIITIPSSVISIGEDALKGCTIRCYADSYSYNYAIERGLKVEIIK